MAEISVIGSAWIEECIHCVKPTIHTGTNLSTITRYYSGDMYNIAYTMSQFNIPTSFCTKYGNDLDSAQLWNQLNEKNIMLYGPTVTEKIQNQERMMRSALCFTRIVLPQASCFLTSSRILP